MPTRLSPVRRVCNQLMGHMIVESAGSSIQNDIDWRETMQSHRLIPLPAVAA